MSSILVEDIHLRLRAELKRCGVTLAAASRSIGESSPQRLKDVVSGRQKCPADLIARLIAVGVDPIYVLTGAVTLKNEVPLSSDEAILVDAYRSLSPSKKREALIQMMRENTAPKTESATTQTISGSNNRVAGRDFFSKE